jgi:peptidyl-prolyl cis-trans isomerase SurA
MKFLQILMAACLVLGATAPARAETVSGIAAVVNDRIITTHQLARAVADFQATEGAGRILSPGDLADLRSQLLSGMIEESLVAQKVEQLGIVVGNEEIEGTIQDVLKQNKLTREQLVIALERQGMKFEDYRENLRKQLLRFKLVGREVQSKVEVTTQEVRDYFREHIDDYREPPFMRISRLTFPAPKPGDPLQRADVSALAETARGRLTAGEALPAVLLDYAHTGNATGGDMGDFKEGELNPVFDRAIRDLGEGAVSSVIEAPNGDLYIFKVDVRKPGSILQFDAVKGEIERTLLEQNREKRFQEWAQGLKKAAYIDIRI